MPLLQRFHGRFISLVPGRGQPADADKLVGAAADSGAHYQRTVLFQGLFYYIDYLPDGGGVGYGSAAEMKDVVSNSAGLAQLLNKDYVSAAQTLRAIKNSNGLTDYLQAIVCARQGNEGMAGFFLRQAIEKDASLAAYAANDLELSKVEK